MRFIHTADLHLGKSIYGLSLIENGDQPVWAERFIETVRQTAPDAVVIAGDVFDRSAPSEEAVRLFGRIITEINEMGIPVLTSAGNHDSVYRLSYLGSLLAAQGVHFSCGLSDSEILTHVTVRDEYGPVTFWLMPYVFPALVQKVLEDDSIRDYETAVSALLSRQPLDIRERNVIVAHQNVTADGKEADRDGSETMAGGVGQLDHSVFDTFDYAALGHIHRSYAVGRPAVRYAGSPLCYHFDETRRQARGPLMVTLGDKGEPVQVERLEIEPLHPMRYIKGRWEDIRAEELESDAEGEYISIVITDRRITPETAAFFRELYSQRGSVLMELRSEYTAFGGDASAMTAEKLASLEVEALFADFYRQRSGDEEPSAQELELMNFAGELTRRAEGRPDRSSAPEDTAVEVLLQHLLEAEIGEGEE